MTETSTTSPPGLARPIEAGALRTLLGLPRPMLRVIAGRPVVIDDNTLDVDIQVILRLQKLAGGAAERPSLEERRRSMRAEMETVGGRQPIGSTRDLSVDGAEGPLPARLYVPRASPGSDDGLLVFFHGGGWALGDLEAYDPLCRFLAEQSGVRVLSVDYRLAPEHPYPAGPNDAWAALRWAHEHAAELGANPARVAVGGDSAGGSLAALTAIRAAEEGLPLRLQLLIYPATRIGDSGPSRKSFGDGYMLDKEEQTFLETQYLGGQDLRDPGHSVGFRTAFPEGLAPAVIAIAGFDPLRDEENDYAELLRSAGHTVAERFYPGLVHGFANIIGCGRSCRTAVEQLAADLRSGVS
ncbi:alpha/beta hydrolase [Streptomyces sp. NPDC002623]